MTQSGHPEAGAAPRVAVTSLGCKVNFAEMSELAGTLAAAGWDVVAEQDHADVRILNSCTVTMQADATTRKHLRRLRRADPGALLVLTGCSVDGNPDQFSRDASRRHGVDAVYPNLRKHEIADDLLRWVGAREAAPDTGEDRSALRSRAFIKVQDGCNHRCTYCIVWQARGVARSRGPASVSDAVARAIELGHGEVTLCGVDLGSYGRDLGTDLATLLGGLLEQCSDSARIRLSSINANDVTPAVIELNAHPRLCAHWHLPLQSGSDPVLRRMHRGYRRAQYLHVVRQLRERNPLTEITTDVMVGFPGETDADHEQTLSLIDEVGFHSCHVFRWSPRPGTPATEYADPVDAATSRRRSAEVRRAALRAGDASRQRAVGRAHEVVWERPASTGARGLSSTYHEIEVPGASPPPGSLGHVFVTAVAGDHLEGTLIP
ncbi:MAG: MiaB/RimO family radical SAM methylthiotransferase [Candidatus Dormibacteraeota bacterium]|nr:MiaB/RimO family radical SAM methylthiotransferase [Candidatus Dormibacteraeota bacterium]